MTDGDEMRMITLASIEWVDVPAGEFLYGEHGETRTLPAFHIMRDPVTVTLYRAYCALSGTPRPTEPPWGSYRDHPVVNVTWYDAAAFCEWAGACLPTDEQWEKAARGTDGREYPWGNEWDASKCVCSVAPAKASSTEPVGERPDGASPYGCLDMAGNVWEWCADWYDATMRSRVLRGGSWYGRHESAFRAACRNRFLPGEAACIRGFRCVSRPESD
jgi:formylglycine-generating enzyme required for sulfatase activity